MGVNLRRNSTIVLMYHGIGTPAPYGELHYTITEDSFAQQIDAFARAGRVVPYGSMLGCMAHKHPIVITFDDGEKSVISKAFPLMQDYGMVGTVFMTTDWIGRPGYLDEDDLSQLVSAGWNIGAHGVTHRLISDLDKTESEEELINSRNALESILGRPILDMSLPGGRNNRQVTSAVRRAGYRSLCTSSIGMNAVSVNPYKIRRYAILRGFDMKKSL